MNQGRIEQIGTPQETYERPASAFVSQFLGKTNDFAATVERTAAPARLVAGSWSAPAPAGVAGPVTVSIRPERIGFADTGLAAKIVTRIFQGNHWLFQCESECGPAIVIRQNDGTAAACRRRGGAPGSWRSDDMSLRAAGGGRMSAVDRHCGSERGTAPVARERAHGVGAGRARADAVRRRAGDPARDDGDALVPRLGPVQRHRAGLHPEELARDRDRSLLRRDVRAHVPHRAADDADHGRARRAGGLYPQPHGAGAGELLPARDPRAAADLGGGAHARLGAFVRRQQRSRQQAPDVARADRNRRCASCSPRPAW